MIHLTNSYLLSQSIMKTQSIEDLISETSEKLLVDFLLNLESSITKELKSHALELIGFTNKYGRTEIDSRRSDSIIKSHITEVTKDTIRDSINDILLEMTPKLVKKHRAKFEEFYEEEFTHSISRELLDLAHKKGAAMASEISQKHVNALKEQLAPITLDIKDPKFCDSIHGKIEAILLSHKIASENSKKKQSGYE